MGILRNRCSYIYDSSEEFMDEVALADLISGHLDNTEELNDANHFCSLWSSEKPISDTIVMFLLMVISLLDLVVLITLLIEYDVQRTCKISPFTFLFQLNLILAILLTIAIVLYACFNRQAVG
uniref:G_PROTEIN_RECEP_F1_2 domain-containing protein n=1 Tax=Elaeophora elaphi TaxID=1147741 RepID=A0A0R3S670_9BILA